MKRIYLIFIFVFSIALLLIGCSDEEDNRKDDFGLEKVQKVEVLSAQNTQTVLSIIDEKAEVNEFVDKLKIDKWSMEDIPSNLTKGNLYKIYQADTIKLGESKKDKKDLKLITIITTYKDSPYIELKTKIVDVTFKVPKDVAEYLNKEK